LPLVAWAAAAAGASAQPPEGGAPAAETPQGTLNPPLTPLEAAADPAPASPGGPDESPADPIWHLCPQDGPCRLRGWLDAGGIYNSANPESKFNGPYNAVDRNQEPMFNQAYLILERLLPTDGSFGMGGRLDLLYGEDFFLAQSVGLELHDNGQLKWNQQFYGLAIPQAYLEAGDQAFSVKVGHYYTIVGYESVQSPSNFFYSHSYSYQFAGPFTHWGALADWKPCANWEIQAGPTLGWNTLSSTSNHVSFLGSVKYTDNSKKWWSSFAITTGEEPTNPAQLPDVSNGFTNRTRYSFLIDLTPTSNWEYVFHHWLGFQENGAPGDGATAWWYGVDQYLYCKLTNELRVGVRLEWFRDEEGTRVGLNRPDNPNKPPLAGNYYSMTFGFNYAPCPNFILRPELRYDTVGNNTRQPFDDGTKDHQFMLGVDAILHF
jgi:hypothetical protein